MEYKNAVDLYNEAKKYENVQSIELTNLFKEAHVFFPDFINRFILLNICKKHIFNEGTMLRFTAEFQFKLRSYNFFSVFLLNDTVKKYDLEVSASEYKNMFMRFYLQNHKKFKISSSFGAALKSYENKVGPSETIGECLANFESLFYTPKGYLDGINLSIIKEAICTTYNITDVVDLAKKNGVDIPKRLNKAELLALISARLLLSDEEKAALQVKPITDICTYSKQRGFRISPDLKKADMVEYLVYSLGKYHEDTEKDLYNYDIIVDEDDPKTDVAFDELEVDKESIPVSSNLVDAPQIETPVEFEVQEEKVEAEVKTEEVQEEVQEEKVEAEVKTEEVQEEVQEEPVQEPVIEENNVVTEEIKGENEVVEVSEDNKPLKEEMENAIYYDTQVDQEIRDIIKKYYNKKKHKDVIFRASIIVLLSLILIFSVVVLLKLLQAF